MRLLPKQPVTVRGKEIGGKQPLICLPLVSRTEGELFTDLKLLIKHRPDLIEWRADFFVDLSDVEKTLAIGRRMRDILGEIPIIFTIRWEKEGGQAISISEQQKIDIIEQMCRERVVDIVDYELHCSEVNVSHLRKVTATQGVKLIVSHHNFKETPPTSELLDILRNLEQSGADIVKLAVMPNHWDDVLTLMQTTLIARQLLDVPMITMAMGKYGVVTRLVGGVFGSDVTFALGTEQSAPGQVPIDDVRLVVDTLAKYI